MIIDQFSANSQNHRQVAQSRWISAVKAVSWRALGTLDTIVISYLLTGTLKIAFAIGSIEIFTKMALYFLHERAWVRGIMYFSRRKSQRLSS